MDEDLWALLTGSSAVTAIVPAARIVWGELPQGAALPAVVLQIIGETDGPTLAGTDGLWFGRVQVDCYGLTRPSARILSRAIVNLLNGYHGGRFQGVFLDSTREMRETERADRPFRFSTDFNVTWS